MLVLLQHFAGVSEFKTDLSTDKVDHKIQKKVFDKNHERKIYLEKNVEGLRNFCRQVIQSGYYKGNFYKLIIWISKYIDIENKQTQPKITNLISLKMEEKNNDSIKNFNQLDFQDKLKQEKFLKAREKFKNLCKKAKESFNPEAMQRIKETKVGQLIIIAIELLKECIKESYSEDPILS